MKLPKLPFGKKPDIPAPKRFSGLSQKKSGIGMASPKPPQSSKTPTKANPVFSRKIFHDITIYTALIKSDIKHLLKIDNETYQKKQAYDDFMENHFGKDWRKMK